MAMICEVSRHGATACLTIKGTVYENDAKLLKQQFKGLPIEQLREVVIDLGGVSYFGSSGIGKLLLFYKNLAATNGTLRLTRTPDHLAQLFRDLRLDSLFEINN